MKVLVTGSNGFVGSHLTEALVKDGHTVRCVVRKTSNLKHIENLPVELYYADLGQQKELESAVKDVDVVINNAGVTKALTEDIYYNGNAQAVENLLSAVVKSGVKLKRFIHVSSQAVMGSCAIKKPKLENDVPEPITPYGRTKKQGEDIALKYIDKVPITILRPCSIYGPRDHEFHPLFKNLKMKIYPIIGSPEKFVHMLYVTDFVKVIISSINFECKSGEAFFITDGETYNMIDIKTALEEASGVKLKLISVPDFVAKNIIAPIVTASSLIARTPFLLNKDKIKELSQDFWLCDITKAKTQMGYKPEVQLKHGFELVYQWYKDNKWI